MKKLIVLLTLNILFAQVPHKMSFQAYLSDANDMPIAPGSYEMTFRIYDALTEGNKMWEETQTVTVEGSLVSVMLGNTAPLVALSSTGYLEIQIKDDILSPRQELGASMFSLQAENSVWADTSTFTKSIPEYFGLKLDSLSGRTDSLFTLVGNDTSFVFTYDTVVIRDSLYIFTYDTVYLTYPELPPHPPTMVNVSMSGNDILLSWSSSASENVSSYSIYRDNSYVASVDSTITSYTQDNYSYNDSICYFVKAVSASGLQSNASQEACITTPESPNLLDVKIINVTGSIIKIYKNNTDSGNLILESKPDVGVYTFYDVLTSGEHIIFNNYCNCMNISQEITTDVVITTDATQPYYYTISAWSQ